MKKTLSKYGSTGSSAYRNFDTAPDTQVLINAPDSDDEYGGVVMDPDLSPQNSRVATTAIDQQPTSPPIKVKKSLSRYGSFNLKLIPDPEKDSDDEYGELDNGFFNVRFKRY